MLKRTKQYALGLRTIIKPYTSHPVLVFLVISSAQWIVNANLTVGVSSLGQIQQKFNVSSPIASWLMSAYSLCFASFVMIFGRFGDIVGHHYQYVCGMFFLGVLIVIAASVENLYAIIVFRALQGIAAASTVPSSYALIGHSFEGKALNLAMGVVTVLMTVSAGMGFVFGGAFALIPIGYRGVFYLFGGLSLLTAILGLFCIDPVPKNSKRIRDLDVFGVFMVLSGILLFVTGVTEGGFGWRSPRSYVPMIFGVLLIGFHFLWEWRLVFMIKLFKNTQLLIPPSAWGIPNFIVFNIAVGLAFSGMVTMILCSLEIYQYVALNSPVIAAVKTIVGPISILLASFPVGYFYGKISPKIMITIGGLIQLAGAILLTQLDYTTKSYWKYGFPGLILAGLGCSIAFYNSMQTLVVTTPVEIRDLVPGIANTSVELLIAATTASLASIIGQAKLAVDIEIKDEMIMQYHHALYLPLGLVGANVILSIFIQKRSSMVSCNNETPNKSLETSSSTFHETPHENYGTAQGSLSRVDALELSV